MKLTKKSLTTNWNLFPKCDLIKKRLDQLCQDANHSEKENVPIFFLTMCICTLFYSVIAIVIYTWLYYGAKYISYSK